MCSSPVVGSTVPETSNESYGSDVGRCTWMNGKPVETTEVRQPLHLPGRAEGIAAAAAPAAAVGMEAMVEDTRSPGSVSTMKTRRKPTMMTMMIAKDHFHQLMKKILNEKWKMATSERPTMRTAVDGKKIGTTMDGGRMIGSLKRKMTTLKLP